LPKWINRQELKSVEKEIKDLLKKETKLLKKVKTGQINDEESIDLEGIGKLLKELKEDKNYWQRQVELANKGDTAEPEAKSFSEADQPWIESVCDVNCQYRKWTSYILDETVQLSEKILLRLWGCSIKLVKPDAAYFLTSF
jgi:hypothetical protein